MDVVVTVSPSPNLINHVSLDPFDIVHAFPSCSLPCPSFKCYDLSSIDSPAVLEWNEVDCSEFLGTFREYDPSLDLYSMHLMDMPEKIMLTIAFDYSIDFSKTFDKFRRALTIIPGFMFL